MKYFIGNIFFLFLLQTAFGQDAKREKALLDNKRFIWVMNADTLVAPQTILKEVISFYGGNKAMFATYWVEDSLRVKKNKPGYDFTEALPAVSQESSNDRYAQQKNRIEFTGGLSFKINVDPVTNAVKSLKNLKTGKVYFFDDRDNGVRIGKE